MRIDKLVEVGRELCKPDEQVENAGTEVIICQKSGDWERLFAMPSDLWAYTGWLLERFPEWEGLRGFQAYHASKKEPPYYTHFYDVVPLDWLTSPSILPEKVGEYIEWRDGK